MIIQLPYDNAQVVKRKHDAMKAWHEDMAKSHMIAAEWHAEQSEEFAKAMKEVPLDPEQKPAPQSGARGTSTDAPDATPTPSTSLPLDPMKKSDLIQILNDHVAEFGSIGIKPEDIADILLGE